MRTRKHGVRAWKGYDCCENGRWRAVFAQVDETYPTFWRELEAEVRDLRVRQMEESRGRIREWPTSKDAANQTDAPLAAESRGYRPVPSGERLGGPRTRRPGGPALVISAAVPPLEDDDGSEEEVEEASLETGIWKTGCRPAPREPRNRAAFPTDTASAIESC
ncbi:hypothetical protein ALC62_15652 [Cyphomyrmex costatus]|uniref:Uncharacterized protein n=1 Tax=Cyphomyrmex costatus TaxID=456900 RepID=A0A151I6V3_9HYME|nr:hypothetical protein ALC62_15652 [Cyphomyrmex costatus]